MLRHMPPELRHIAVHVEEPHAGKFTWVLSEQGEDGSWDEIERASKETDTYRQAMADGLLALQADTENLDIGPRRKGQTTAENSPSTRRPLGEEYEDAPQGSGTPSPYFGFGPAA